MDVPGCSEWKRQNCTDEEDDNEDIIEESQSIQLDSLIINATCG